jgi:predicted peptidase
MKTLCYLTIFLCMQLFAQAQDYSAFSHETYIHNGDTLRYRMLPPANYDIHKTYPLVVFLVIFPQCPSDSTWAPLHLIRDNAGRVMGFDFKEYREPIPGQLVKSLVDSLLQTHKINSKKVYIGGLSLGGMGTFDLLARYPKTWAAGFPICGAGDTANAKNFAKVPVWIFHGGADPVVPVTSSRDYYKVLQDLHADVHYTEYPGVGHNSWDNVFAEPGLLKWLFSNTKK